MGRNMYVKFWGIRKVGESMDNHFMASVWDKMGQNVSNFINCYAMGDGKDCLEIFWKRQEMSFILIFEHVKWAKLMKNWVK